jgi:hypothetical protein
LISLRRRHQARLPAELEASLGLEPDERVLADAAGPDGHWYAGTASALHLNEGTAWRRIPWERIERAEWDADASTLTLVEVTDWGQPERPLTLEIVETARLLELIRERITKSVVIRVFAAVHGRKGLSVIGRRGPAGDGDVTWSYVIAAGLDPEDPLVAQVAERTLQEAQAELGWL